jgi:hypothetical protein
VDDAVAASAFEIVATHSVIVREVTDRGLDVARQHISRLDQFKGISPLRPKINKCPEISAHLANYEWN